MEHLPKDPRIDNPLKITNDARKAGLDYRLIDPEAGDYDGSKSNAAVERIFQIWQDTAADKGTQLVFCDLSTPKGGSAAPAPVPGLEFVEEDFAAQSDVEPGAGAGTDSGMEANVEPGMHFQLESEYTPQGDQPQAIDELCANLEQRLPSQVLLGATGTGKTFTMMPPDPSPGG